MPRLPPATSRPWSAPSPARAPLAGEVEADVVVVGGGIAGLTTAVLLVRAGVRVRVLEAGVVGQGTTGGSTAKVSALQALRLSELRAAHGDDAVVTYTAAQLAGQAWIATRAEARAVDCGLERREAVTYTTEADRVGRVEAEAEACAVAGLDVTVTEGDDALPFPVARTVRLADQLQIDPQAWVDDLAAEVDGADGSAVHEHSPVTGFADGHRTAVTADGRVRADHVVLATLLPISDRGLFFARAEPAMSHGVTLVAEGDVPTAMSYGTDSDMTRSLRTTTDGDHTLLLIGGEGHTVGRRPDTLAAQQALADWGHEWFPLGTVAHRWAVHDLRSADLLPFAGRADRLPGSPWIATGFGKWGMTSGTAAAMTIAGGITGQGDHPWDRLFSPRRSPGWKGARDLGKLNAEVAGEMGRGWAVPTSGNPPSAPSIARCGAVPCAEGPDGGGRVKLVCTHLGGIVRWDEAQRTWDCPLHGSRFAADGTVVAGPAVRRLPRG